MTKVVHCKKEPYDIYIGRPGIWGNPFQIGKDGTREQVIAKFRDYLLDNDELLSKINELEDKVLGCWCKPLACHGDVYIEFLNYRVCPICNFRTLEYVGKADAFFCHKYVAWLETDYVYRFV